MRIKLSLILLLLSISAHAQCGKVVNVADGDTFTLLTDNNRQVKIRLHGVDAPEKGQPYGMAAKEFLSSKISGKAICIDSMTRDRYGRTIALVIVKHDTINIDLIKNGYAWHYKKYDNNPYWAKHEDDARYFKKGLWEESATAPWEYRKKKHTK